MKHKWTIYERGAVARCMACDDPADIVGEDSECGERMPRLQHPYGNPQQGRIISTPTPKLPLHVEVAVKVLDLPDDSGVFTSARRSAAAVIAKYLEESPH